MCENEHVHIVLTAKHASQATLKRLANIAQNLVAEKNVHIVSANSIDDFQNNIVEPFARGGSPAIGFAGCQLYRLDPTAVMVLVDADMPTASLRLPANFEKLVSAANVPGSLISLGASHEANAGIYAWSIYALMETYRNYCPIDFQVLNEMAKVWSGDSARLEELYGKLNGEPVTTRLLCKVRPGYPTRNVIVPEMATSTTSAAPVRGGMVSDGAVISTPEESV